MSRNYEGIIDGIVTVLQADGALTSLLAQRTIGGQISGKFSIFYGWPPGTGLLWPAVSLRETTLQPNEPAMQEAPMGNTDLELEASIFGSPSQCRPVAGELDSLFQTCYFQAAMDTAQWQFRHIDTSGGWVITPIPKQIVMDDTGQLVQFVKTFTISASSLTG